MDIIIGSDHAGFELKQACKVHLEKSGHHQVMDVGVHSRRSADYPRIAHKVAGAIANGEFSRGLLICGTGLGMSMVANRYPGVRAALCHNLYTVKMGRRHNDANILVMGDRVIGKGMALEMLELFLTEKFDGGRHQSRLDEID